MTTSGTYTFNPSLGELTLYAYNLAGLRNTSVLQEHMEASRMATNMMLARWSNQGVMLLNRVLTVTAGESGSHSKLGWQEITEKIISHCASLGAVGLLWGSSARELAPVFDRESLVEGVHPSPLSAHRGFLGSKPFSKVNQILESKGKTAIIW